MKGLHFVTGEKGGIGKSLFAMVLLEYLHNLGIDHKFYDADRSSPDVGLTYGESPESTTREKSELDDFTCFDDVLAFDDVEETNSEKDFIPLEESDPQESTQPSQLVSQVYFSEDQEESFKADRLYEEASNGLVVVNLPAQVELLMDKWLRDRSIIEDDSLNIHYWYVTDGSPESLTLLDRSLKRYGNRIKHIVVRNKGLNKLVDKNLMSNPVVQTMRSLGLRRTVELPQLVVSNAEMQTIKTNKVKLSEVLTSDIKGLNSLTKLRTKSFLKSAHHEIDRTGVFAKQPESTLEKQTEEPVKKSPEENEVAPVN